MNDQTTPAHGTDGAQPPAPPAPRPERDKAPKPAAPPRRRGRQISPLAIANLLAPILAKVPAAERNARAGELRAVLVSDDQVEAVDTFRKAGHVVGADWDAALTLVQRELDARG